MTGLYNLSGLSDAGAELTDAVRRLQEMQALYNAKFDEFYLAQKVKVIGTPEAAENRGIFLEKLQKALDAINGDIVYLTNKVQRLQSLAQREEAQREVERRGADYQASKKYTFPLGRGRRQRETDEWARAEGAAAQAKAHQEWLAAKEQADRRAAAEEQTRQTEADRRAAEEQALTAKREEGRLKAEAERRAAATPASMAAEERGAIEALRRTAYLFQQPSYDYGIGAQRRNQFYAEGRDTLNGLGASFDLIGAVTGAARDVARQYRGADVLRQAGVTLPAIPRPLRQFGEGVAARVKAQRREQPAPAPGQAADPYAPSVVPSATTRSWATYAAGAALAYLLYMSLGRRG